MNCCFCGDDCEKFNCSASPYSKGRCCDWCNYYLVVQAKKGIDNAIKILESYKNCNSFILKTDKETLLKMVNGEIEIPIVDKSNLLHDVIKPVTWTTVPSFASQIREYRRILIDDPIFADNLLVRTENNSNNNEEEPFF